MTTESEIVIEAQGLAKRFDGIQAVAEVDFAVRAGEFFGFLGPNGAGKTTTINMLTGLARPDAGKINIAGIDCSRNPKAAQHLIGIVPDESNLYPELTGYENLTFCAALYGIGKNSRERRASELLEVFGLAEAGKRKFGGYSRGMKRKLTIAAGIIHQPRILFLDEPTTGIDIASARQIRALIANLHREGTTVFLTTHYIEEAERLCDRIAFIVEGKVVRIDTLAALMEETEGRHVVQFGLSRGGGDFSEEFGKEFPSFRYEFAEEGKLRVEASEAIKIGPIVRFFEERGVEVGEARKVQVSLEEVFVRVTGIEATAMRQERERTKGSA